MKWIPYVRQGNGSLIVFILMGGVLSMTFEGCSGCESLHQEKEVAQTDEDDSSTSIEEDTSEDSSAETELEPDSETAESTASDENSATANQEASSDSRNSGTADSGNPPNGGGASPPDRSSPSDAEGTANRNSGASDSGSLPPSQNSAAGRSKRRSRSQGNPTAALQQARKLHEEARRDAAQGEHGQSFVKTRKAWELVKDFPEHRECRQFTDQLFNEFDNLARQANRKVRASGSLSNSKTLIEM